MQINSDLSQRVVIDSNELPWSPSPMAGVERRMLDRVAAESGRATSLVRYAPETSFPMHGHPRGEEILVLSGTFSDGGGDYPAGSYLRSPPGSQHAPFSTEGCVLFVKLDQFAPLDGGEVRFDTRQARWMPGLVTGLSVMPLHEFEGEHSALVRWAPGTIFNRHRHWGGEEILVLEGVFQDEHGTYPAGTWLRSPHLSEHKPFSTEGCVIYVKTGHLG
ncbi:MAG: cupin domain-containing protein [Azonexus sp.]|jgi:anti-sigma factor ChrR (cupin superfamily)